MLYEFPNFGTIRVSRNGEDGGDRWKWNFTATDPNHPDKTFRSWGTAPKDWDATSVLGLACDGIALEVEDFTGDDTGNGWTLYARDFDDEEDEAANYAVGLMFYRMECHAYNPDGETFATKEEVRDYLRAKYRAGAISEDHTQFIYPNNSDEPLGCYTFGPRGGLVWENY